MSPVSPPFHLILMIHAHQPAGNFEHIFEECYQKSYDAFLALLEKHPGVRAALHFSGPLLLWIETHHPGYFARLRGLVKAGQIELIGGGFYEPILISIPIADQHEQLVRLSDYLQQHFSKRPTGAWLSERVWEPQLPSVLAAAGVKYTLVDDLPFLAAGFHSDELFGPYIAEDCGNSVWVFPGLKELRYLIPFRKVSESIEYLKTAARVHPGGVACFGDDMEKFGVWPETFEHCYTDGWLEEFFVALEDNASWLQPSLPSDYLATHVPRGRADLPSASYAEMMEWVLPTAIRQKYYAVGKEFAARPDVLSFIRGGSWRGFFRKYPESNLLHKKMLRASSRVAGIPSRKANAEHAALALQARDFLLRGQGNDAYWHGVFGGLYAPHLRTEIWRNLVRAETLADQLTPGGSQPRVELLDYDSDGCIEALFTAPEYQALLKPSDGGTIAAFDFRPAHATIINSLARRPEAYHQRLLELAASPPETQGLGMSSIHGQARVKEANLQKFLRYDRYNRHSFRLLLFDPSRTARDYDNLQLHENSTFAAGAFQLRASSAGGAELFKEGAWSGLGDDLQGSPRLSVTKQFLFGPSPHGSEISCEIRLSLSEPVARDFCVGLESIVNFLAPADDDRFFETPAGPHNLRYAGALPGPFLRVEDGWQRIRMILHAPDAAEYWVAPIETVSESEGGFERVYQGSQILAVWRPDCSARTQFSARLLCRLELI